MSATRPTLDVAVIGAGPNGLTAAVLLARAGLAVEVFEANDQPGGGCRSAQLTQPGFTHDLCAAVHPMGVLSSVFRELELEKFGLEWVQSHHPLAHPLPDGGVAVLERSLEETGRTLGADAPAWRRMLEPFSNRGFIDSLLNPIWYPRGGHLLAKMRFGLLGLRSCEGVARSAFGGGAARALFAGCAAHSVVALDRPGTASFGLMLAAAAHAIDWPVAKGGSQAITAALVRALHAAGDAPSPHSPSTSWERGRPRPPEPNHAAEDGRAPRNEPGMKDTLAREGAPPTSSHPRPRGRMHLGCRITRLGDLPPARAYVFDVNPRQVAAICGEALPASFRAKYERFPHGPAVFKVDWALSGPIPWRNPECRAATTVHVCGAFEDVLRSESEMMAGRIAEKPFVLVAQQSLVDPTRAPAGRHTGWAYCHVPNGCATDMTSAIEVQIERFAPGFRDCILARHTVSPRQLNAHNLAMIGGDMAGGRNTLLNFLLRPVARWNPYTTPNPRIFICSSSTPPGGGVHGMCGYHAARAVMRRLGVRPR